MLLAALLLTSLAAAQTAPVVVEGATPDYPAEARDRGISGSVVVRLTVAEDGHVGAVEVVQPLHPLLDAAAEVAAFHLRFQPATLDGVPVVAQVDYRFEFALSTSVESGDPVDGSLDGLVQDLNGVPVAGARVTLTPEAGVQDLARTVTTRDDGSFVLPFLAAGPWTARVEAPGFDPVTAAVPIRRGATLEQRFLLVPPSGFAEVVVQYGEKRWREVERGALGVDPGTVTGSYTLTRRDIESTPGALEDVARAVHALPGVASDGDVLARFWVRGSSDVQFQLDRVPLDNPFHLAGFNSIFNPDMLREVQFYAGTAPAQVPAGTGAVMAVESWDGSAGQDGGGLDGAVDLSASSARAFVMGPVGPSGDDLTFAVAARRTYLEGYFQAMKALGLLGAEIAPPEFSELSARVAWHPGTHRLLLTVLRTGDSLAFLPSDDDVAINPEQVYALDNRMWFLALDHRWEGPSLAWQSTAAWVDDDGTSTRGWGERQANTTRLFARTDVTWAEGRHEVQFGAHGDLFGVQAEGVLLDPRVVPTGAVMGLVETSPVLLEAPSMPLAPEASLYAQHTWAGPVQARWGGRATWSSVTGELLPSPRLGLSVPLATATVPKVALGLYQRAPRDPVVTGLSPGLRAERALSAVAGLDQGFPLPGADSGGLVRVEAWGSWLDRLPVGVDDPALLGTVDPFTNEGTGRNVGVDVLVSARAGRMSGLATLALLDARRTNPRNTVLGVDYRPEQDQRLTAGLTGELQLTPRWRTTVRASFHTGRPYAALALDPTGVPVVVGLNTLRLGPTHQVDLRGEWRRAFDRLRVAVYAEVLNVTNHKGDFLPVWTVVDGDLVEGRLSHLPIRPFAGVRVDF